MELCDDPFEVQFKNNYELLEDEYHESLKRKMVLDEKIESLLQTRLHLHSSKVAELYETLTKKNATIYIQRSQQMGQNTTMRTALLTWHLEGLDLVIVADPSYHGTDRVVAAMKEIDIESPFPEEGLEFSTLWCRMVRGSISSTTIHLRDFPLAMLEVRELHMWGQLIGAEQEATKRAKRASVVEVGKPWGDVSVERSMTSLKFYHDLTWDMESMSMAYGPCWEPVMAQVQLNMDYINKPSTDPSPALPWWDKMRLAIHGHLTLSAQRLTGLMHVSLDPYNSTELLEMTWLDVIMDWTNAKIMMKGNLDIFVHTASKYDECRLLHIPNLKMSLKLDWLCLGNPNDHHSIWPCASDKVPEYSSNQVHDSYRAFRSQNLNMSLSLETKPVALETIADVPTMLLYGSTLRWLENLKVILASAGRLTRRGKLFHNTKPRKPQLGRHYRNVWLAITLHKFQVCYWNSFAKQRGIELLGGRLSLSSEHSLTMVPVMDGLIHRPRPDWAIVYMNCDLGDSEMWLYSQLVEMVSEESEKTLYQPSNRSYFLSVSRVSYGRETKVKDLLTDQELEDMPVHRLVVHGLKGAWTKNNRDVVFRLFDTYTKATQLRRNLSTEAMKAFKVESQLTPMRSRSQTTNSGQGVQTATHSPVSRLQSGHAASMLQKLIAEAEVNPMVYTEEIEGSTREQQLHGVAACQTDDVVHKNWLIELVNSQVMLRGCETSGYVIVSAAKAQILQRLHHPVWKERRTLVSKTTWVGSLECMQYYATVDAGEPDPEADKIMWLTLDNIEERASMIICDLPDLVGSGHSAGGVVSNTVGGTSDPSSAPLQLQRIISRCGCQFFYVNYGEHVDPNSLEEVPPLPEDNEPWEQEVAVDCFTLTHHDLEICTNSLQYAMILDLVNNLLLYVEPRKKEAIERLQRMRFQLQLGSIEDQREPIQKLQNQVRLLLSHHRHVEKEAYMVHRALNDDDNNQEELLQQLEKLEQELYDCKEQLNTCSEELSMMISCCLETQVSTNKNRQKVATQIQEAPVVRRNEVCFKHAQWRLTDADGLLGIADLVLSNFLYSKVTKSDNCIEHLLELGYIKMTNLLPNQIYKDVLQPSHLQPNVPIDQQRILRIFCRDRPPVGGISVKEHLEVNINPLTIELTHAFFTAMFKFFFPGRDSDEHHGEEEQESSSGTLRGKKRGALRHQKGASFGSSGQSHSLEQDDIEKMKERAARNHSFVYVKIPEIPLRVSYKGGKEKNIEDLNNYSLVLPMIEYHNRTWTWLDLLMEMKNDTKKVLLPQAIKQKLQIKSNRTGQEETPQPQADDKARMLLGANLSGKQEAVLPQGGPEKGGRKGIFKAFR